MDLNGLGWIPGADEDSTSAIEGLPGTAGFLTSGSVDAGESFDLVFISYDAPLAWDGGLEFIASLVIAPEEVGSALLVAEPAALGVLALALCAARAGGAPKRAGR